MREVDDGSKEEWFCTGSGDAGGLFCNNDVVTGVVVVVVNGDTGSDFFLSGSNKRKHGFFSSLSK